MPRKFIYYAGIGAAGTAAHFAVLFGLVEFLDADPIVGSTLGFIVGAIVNYFLNYKYTFNSNAKHLPTLFRFFIVAFIGSIMNLAIMTFLVGTVSFHYLLAQAISTGVIVVITFLINKIWTFRADKYVE